MCVDDRLNLLDKDINKALKKVEEAEDEKFTAVLSNPPYQTERSDDNGSFNVYHHFMNVAKIIGKNVSMIYPFKWVIGGQGEGIDAFRNTELNSKKYKKFIVKSGDSEVFKNVVIKAGVNYFLWQNNDSSQKMEYIYNDIISKRSTLLNNREIMLMNPSYDSIVDKVNTIESIHAYSWAPYGTKTQVTKTKIKDIVDPNGKLTIFYSGVGGGVHKEKVNINVTREKTDDYKLFTSTTADPSKGSLRRLNRIFVGKPNEICALSFMKIGSFKTEEEAKNCLFYLKTDFSTFLLGSICSTQHSYAKVYKLIPDVDFATGEIKDKPGTFLDFDSPETLDEQLAKIYELTEEEQELMAKSIKPWKDKLDVDADGLY